MNHFQHSIILFKDKVLRRSIELTAYSVEKLQIFPDGKFIFDLTNSII